MHISTKYNSIPGSGKKAKTLLEENNFTDVYRDFVDNFYCYYSLLLATKLMNIEPFEVMKSNAIH